MNYDKFDDYKLSNINFHFLKFKFLVIIFIAQSEPT